jgi:hypothetical protein
VSSVDAARDRSPNTSDYHRNFWLDVPLCKESTSKGLVVGSFGFDSLFNTVFEAVSDIYQRHFVFIGGARLLDI